MLRDEDVIGFSFKEYQIRAQETDLYPRASLPKGADPMAYVIWLTEYRTLCLCGEVGELANKVKKLRRDNIKLDKEARAGLAHEIGDTLWYLSTLCSILDLDLSDVAEQNLEMLAKRKEEDKIKGEGDNR